MNYLNLCLIIGISILSIYSLYIYHCPLLLFIILMFACTYSYYNMHGQPSCLTSRPCWKYYFILIGMVLISNFSLTIRYYVTKQILHFIMRISSQKPLQFWIHVYYKRTLIALNYYNDPINILYMYIIR